MEEGKDQLNIQSLLADLKVRTMAQDLNSAAPKTLPVPVSPSPKTTQFAAPNAEPVFSDKQFFEEAKKIFDKGQFQEAISLCQKIAENKSSSWLIKRQANSLIADCQKKQAQIAMGQQQKMAAPQTSASDTPSSQLKIPAPEKTAPIPPINQTKPSPPPTLPILKPSPTTIMPGQATPTPQLPIKTSQPPATPANKTQIAYQPATSSQLPTLKSGTSVPPIKNRTVPKIMFIIGTLVILAGIGYFAWTIVAPRINKIACQEGQITQACLCANEEKTQGFCCNNFWKDKECKLYSLPAPLVNNINGYTEINAQNNDIVSVLADIKIAGQSIQEESARIIAIKIEDASRYVSFEEFISLFNLTIPPEIIENTRAFNLILYTKPDSTYMSDGLSKENRLALVLEQKDTDLIMPAMQLWEITMTEDINGLMLDKPGDSATTTFQGTVYHNGVFRYKNFPTPGTTIDYATNDNFLIIATSKNSAFFIYDAIKNQGINP